MIWLILIVIVWAAGCYAVALGERVAMGLDALFPFG